MPKQTVTRSPGPKHRPEATDNGPPTWAVAYLFPDQGSWTEAEYFRLESSCEGVPRIELIDGRLEVLPVPTELHQLILVYLVRVLTEFVERRSPGVVLSAGMKVRVRKESYREPDVLYMSDDNIDRRHQKAWDGADLVMEIVSPDPEDTERDWEKKPRDYARAGIPEYWIIDPQKNLVRVLTLRGKTYRVHGDFGPGDEATSVRLPGFKLSVDTVLAPPGIKPAR
jgi:Uma2 family endonuclease